MIRKCCKCGELKDIDQFSKKGKPNSKGRITYRYKCKECDKERLRIKSREYMYRKARLDGVPMKNAAGYRKGRWREYKESLSCHDCSMSFRGLHYLCDFHHLDPSIKSFDLGKQNQMSWKRVMDEVAKCVPLCANCHRVRHYHKEPLTT